MADAPSPKARPRVRINCAVSLDGKLAYSGGLRARLSGPKDLARVQRLRAESDAILIGIGTMLMDDPSLRVHWEFLSEKAGHEPLRVIIDSHGRTPPGARVLSDGQPTLMATSRACQREFPAHVDRFRGGEDEVDLPGLLAELARRGVRRLLVEGGSRVIASFLRAGLTDELTVYVAPVLIGGSKAPPLLLGPESHGEEEVVSLKLESAERIDDGVLLSYSVVANRGNPKGHTAPSSD
ncbi:MAG: dihydrofolate reductase family protein [Thermoplasmata archaeon]|nr:dihydrofolate reductase family protein [Thermoplasmata archaeon]